MCQFTSNHTTLPFLMVLEGMVKRTSPSGKWLQHLLGIRKHMNWFIILAVQVLSSQWSLLHESSILTNHHQLYSSPCTALPYIKVWTTNEVQYVFTWENDVNNKHQMTTTKNTVYLTQPPTQAQFSGPMPFNQKNPRTSTWLVMPPRNSLGKTQGIIAQLLHDHFEIL